MRIKLSVFLLAGMISGIAAFGQDAAEGQKIFSQRTAPLKFFVLFFD